MEMGKETGLTVSEKMLLLAMAANETRALTIHYERLNHQTLMTRKELRRAALALFQKGFIAVADVELVITLGAGI